MAAEGVVTCTTGGCSEPAVLQWQGEPDANGDCAAVRACVGHVPEEHLSDLA